MKLIKVFTFVFHDVGFVERLLLIITYKYAGILNSRFKKSFWCLYFNIQHPIRMLFEIMKFLLFIDIKKILKLWKFY